MALEIHKILKMNILSDYCTTYAPTLNSSNFLCRRFVTLTSVFCHSFSTVLLLITCGSSLSPGFVFLFSERNLYFLILSSFFPLLLNYIWFLSLINCIFFPPGYIRLHPLFLCQILFSRNLVFFCVV